MKKILFLTVLLGTVAVGGHAQNYRFGAKGGVNYATLTGMQQANISGRAGLQGGILFMYGVYQPIGFHVELLYSPKGFARDPVVVDSPAESLRIASRDRFHYLDLPFLFKFKKGAFFFEAGPQASFLFRARSETTTTITRPGLPEEIDLQARNALGDVKRFDYGAAAGFGFRVNEDLEVNLRYNAGFRPVRRDQPSPGYDITGQARNTSFQFSVNYFIPGFP
jgi:hypothetical protein